ncbi:MAG: 1-acyl-sn-glycerol-3-phosphate acyltransferase [Phycisphaeraceae bacterium]|nr:1-acyl-sn-glycerol-3-phosphate acyltransferase [Phycisphaeraceae bacterium]MCW5763411.1 1-acyl-sn-glycerol-3-phosphate acyltransferase [Phycisphaeraceae bacterium]
MADTSRSTVPTVPKVPKDTWWRALGYWIVLFSARLTLRVLFRARWLHVDRIPRRGAVLLAGNHQSYLDPPMVATAITKRRICFLARAGLFESTLFGRLISFLNSVPVSEEGSDLVAMRTVIELLEKDQAVLIFPEGSRTETGRVGEFKRGAALLIKRTHCPIVPFAIEGAYDAWPRGQSKPRLFRSRVWVMFAEPIEHDDLMQNGQEAAMLRLRDESVRLRAELRRKMQLPPLDDTLVAEQDTPQDRS